MIANTFVIISRFVWIDEKIEEEEEEERKWKRCGRRGDSHRFAINGRKEDERRERRRRRRRKTRTRTKRRRRRMKKRKNKNENKFSSCWVLLSNKTLLLTQMLSDLFLLISSDRIEEHGKNGESKTQRTERSHKPP
jgi:hypothetical protein